MIPHFLVIGAPKSGTTSLHAYLIQHPELFLPKFKEPHYFCTQGDGTPLAWLSESGEPRPGFINDPVAYAALFAEAGSRLTGESTNSYLSDPAVPARVVPANPDERIIAILRDPVARAISAWK
jgi:hypothetical protein